MRLSEDVLNLHDAQRLARARLPVGIYEWIERGAEDDDAVSNNRTAFRRLRLRPRALRDVSQRSTGVELLGYRVSAPIAIAPTAAAGLVWYNGEIELAKAAAAEGIPYTLATRSTSSIEDIASEVSGAALWFQLYVWAERQLSFRLVERARLAGFETLLVTIDMPVEANREFNKRNGFSLPFVPTATGLSNLLMRPRWLLGVMGRYMATTGMPRYENMEGEHREQITRGGVTRTATRQDSLTWEDIRELRRRWPGRLLVKGVLRVDDARRALECGADGVVVSNHGGRALDTAVASIDALPEIAEALHGRAAVLLDSGIRRGSDIVKAMALGAQGVLIGRPTLYGLSLSGQAGAQRVISLLRAELSTVMGQVGCASVADLGPDLIWRESASRSTDEH
jgi:isopentenyl diphosphate isomerase/L-lactate dehydrogenase-like FMN-dependent dehydrogenase